MPPATLRRKPKPPTERQTEVLMAGLRFRRERGRMPTYRQLAAYMGSRLSTVYHHVLALEKKGYIERDLGVHGGWRIVKRV